MRILFATYYYLPHVGGGTWYPYHVSRRLASRGHHVTLVAPRLRFRLALGPVADSSEPQLVLERANRVPLPLWCAPFMGLLLLRPRIVRLARKSDVLLGQFHPHHSIAFVTVLLGKIIGRSVALRVEDWRRWMYGERPSARARLEFALAALMNAANEWAARRADLLLVVNSRAAAAFARSRSKGQTIRVSPNGVDLDVLDRFPDRIALRKELRLPDGAPIIVFVGRFSGTEYRVDILLEAFESVRENRPDAVLVLVGDDLVKDLQFRHREAIRLGSVLLVGAVPQMTALAYSSAADVAVGPLGPTATTPLKVLEALASGTPVVVGRGSLGRELDGLAPMLEVVPPHPTAVARALLAALDTPPTWPKEAARSLLHEFGWERIAAEVETELCMLTAPVSDA